jgi:hypothetical protein
MASVDFEAWLDQTAPTEIATPIFQSTSTTVHFTVLDADRTAVDLTSYAFKFAAQAVNSSSAMFDVTCVEDGSGELANGKIRTALSVANLAAEGEVLGELRLFSGGDPAGDVTDRVQFRFNVVGKVA